jgi:methionyl-tRNA formyltransferase
MSKKLKIIYIGTPLIAVPPLQKIIANGLFEIFAVITQPDKPVGRKKTITPPPVKMEALKQGLKVLQPDKISDIASEIKSLKPDIMVVMAYSQLLPKSLLDIPRFGAINVHTSLLPKYRGASPIQAAIMNGDKETGITFMLMDPGLDTGPILLEFSAEIAANDTAKSLSDRLSDLAADNIIKTIIDFIDKKITPQPQNNSKASYAKEIKKEDGRINWSLPSNKIEQFIRAMNPWPIAFTIIKNTTLKIFSADIIKDIRKDIPYGEISLINKKMAVKTLDGMIILNSIQPAGKKIMDSKDYLLGNPDVFGKIAQ